MPRVELDFDGDASGAEASIILLGVLLDQLQAAAEQTSRALGDVTIPADAGAKAMAQAAIINAALDSIRDHAGRAALALGAGPLALGGGAAGRGFVATSDDSFVTGPNPTSLPASFPRGFSFGAANESVLRAAAQSYAQQVFVDETAKALGAGPLALPGGSGGASAALAIRRSLANFEMGPAGSSTRAMLEAFAAKGAGPSTSQWAGAGIYTAQQAAADRRTAEYLAMQGALNIENAIGSSEARPKDGGDGGGGGAGVLAAAGGIGGLLGFGGGRGVWIPGLGWGFRGRRVGAGMAGFGTLAGLAGFGAERLITSTLGIGGSLLGGLAGGGLLGAGMLGVAGVGIGTDMAGMGQAAGDIKNVTQALDTLNQAIQTYGRDSTQAAQAQIAFNQAMGGFSPAAQQAVLAASKTAIGFHAAFNALTGPAESIGAQILNQGMLTGERFLPTLGKFAQQNMGIIQTHIQPLMNWTTSSSPQGGLGIFTNLNQIFQKQLPTDIKAATSGIELFAKVIDVAAQRTGGLASSLAAFFGKWNSADNFPKVAGEVNNLIDLFHVWLGLFKDAGGLLFDLFKPSVGFGEDFAKQLTSIISDMRTFINLGSTQGTLRDLFSAHVGQLNELVALLKALGPLLSAASMDFIKVEAAVTSLFTDALKPVVKAVTDLLNIPFVRSVGGWVVALSAMRLAILAIPKVLSLLSFGLISLGPAAIEGEVGVTGAMTRMQRNIAITKEATLGLRATLLGLASTIFTIYIVESIIPKSDLSKGKKLDTSGPLGFLGDLANSIPLVGPAVNYGAYLGNKVGTGLTHLLTGNPADVQKALLYLGQHPDALGTFSDITDPSGAARAVLAAHGIVPVGSGNGRPLIGGGGATAGMFNVSMLNAINPGHPLGDAVTAALAGHGSLPAAQAAAYAYLQGLTRLKGVTPADLQLIYGAEAQFAPTPSASSSAVANQLQGSATWQLSTGQQMRLAAATPPYPGATQAGENAVIASVMANVLKQIPGLSGLNKVAAMSEYSSLSGQMQFALPMSLQLAQARNAALSDNTGGGVILLANQAAAAARKAMASGKLNVQEWLQAYTILGQSIQTDYTEPIGLQLQTAKDTALNNMAGLETDAQKVKAAAEHAMKYDHLGKVAMMDAWNVIAQANQAIVANMPTDFFSLAAQELQTYGSNIGSQAHGILSPQEARQAYADQALLSEVKALRRDLESSERRKGRTLKKTADATTKLAKHAPTMIDWAGRGF